MAYTQENKIKAGLYMIRDKTEERCEICFKNESNTVIEPCMHGGVCKNCLLNILKKKSQCPFCRKVTIFRIINLTYHRLLTRLTSISHQVRGNICTVERSNGDSKTPKLLLM
jgi:hypothetical protein